MLFTQVTRSYVMRSLPLQGPWYRGVPACREALIGYSPSSIAQHKPSRYSSMWQAVTTCYAGTYEYFRNDSYRSLGASDPRLWCDWRSLRLPVSPILRYIWVASALEPTPLLQIRCARPCRGRHDVPTLMLLSVDCQQRYPTLSLRPKIRFRFLLNEGRTYPLPIRSDSTESKRPLVSSVT